MAYVENYKKFDVDDLWISNIRKSKSKDKNEKVFRNVVIYIDPDKYKRLRIKTPFFFIPFGVSEFKEIGKKKFKLTTVLSPLINKRKDFKNMIDRIDDKIEEQIGDKLDDYTLKRSIIKTEYQYEMAFHFPHEKQIELFKIVDHNNNPLNITDVTKRMRGIAYIELSNEWIDDKEEKYPEVIIDEDVFIDELEDNSTVNLEKKTKKKCKLKCPNCEHKIELNINVNVPTTGGGGNNYYAPTYIPQYNNDIPIPPPLDNVSDNGIKPFVPDLDELISMRDKLKPTKIKESNLNKGKVLEKKKKKKKE
jgi:hypothetical protein